MAFSASRSRCSRNGSPNSDDSDRVLIIGEDDETLPLRMIFCWLYIILHKFKCRHHFHKRTILTFEPKKNPQKLRIRNKTEYFFGKLTQTLVFDTNIWHPKCKQSYKTVKQWLHPGWAKTCFFWQNTSTLMKKEVKYFNLELKSDIWHFSIFLHSSSMSVCK